MCHIDVTSICAEGANKKAQAVRLQKRNAPLQVPKHASARHKELINHINVAAVVPLERIHYERKAARGDDSLHIGLLDAHPAERGTRELDHGRFVAVSRESCHKSAEAACSDDRRAKLLSGQQIA